ncbi:hypothetical protein SSCHL_1395 [Staphylococcus schleiferi]|nr:hypothetical protein SSCHL_1395 [Staphylococcus schleiferi]
MVFDYNHLRAFLCYPCDLFFYGKHRSTENHVLLFEFFGLRSEEYWQY